MSKGGSILKHHFYCTCCGNEGIPASRMDSSMREIGHLKRLYCLYCDKEINHVECIEGENMIRICLSLNMSREILIHQGIE